MVEVKLTFSKKVIPISSKDIEQGYYNRLTTVNYLDIKNLTWDCKEKVDVKTFD